MLCLTRSKRALNMRCNVGYPTDRHTHKTHTHIRTHNLTHTHTHTQNTCIHNIHAYTCTYAHARACA